MGGIIKHISKNKARCGVYFLTRGYFASRGYGGAAGRYFQKLVWSSSTFAFLADVVMAVLGGSLKKKEKLTGRFADVLAWMYIGTAILRRFKQEGQKKEHEVVFHYSMRWVFQEIQKAFEGIFKNFEGPLPLKYFMRNVCKWFFRMNALSTGPRDQMGHKLVQDMLKQGELRRILTQGIFVPQDSKKESLARYDLAMKASLESLPVESKVKKWARKNKWPKQNGVTLTQRAFKRRAY